jgi:hypothetical protein
MGGCQYRFNASEQYQRQTPGAGVETHCGGRTYPLHDEPEMVPVTVRDGDTVWTEYQHTGAYLPREREDPYCPEHGGTPAPPPRVLTELELAAKAQQLELQRSEFVAELERAGHEVPPQLEPAPVPQLEPAPAPAPRPAPAPAPPRSVRPPDKTVKGDPDAPGNQ